MKQIYTIYRAPDRSRHAPQTGFTLLEAMVAAGVLSIGLLGLAGLSGLSLGKNVDANDMTRVTNIAADMAERIQSNRQRVLDYHNTNTAAACPQSVSTQRMALGDCSQWQTFVGEFWSRKCHADHHGDSSGSRSYCQSGHNEPVSGHDHDELANQTHRCEYSSN